jgi:tetratricopeptide (TPR) repeat protein
LRSSIANSIYQWRSSPENSRSAAERPRVTKEAEFAFKQAFAYCPYSPEAVFHFMTLLLTQNRIDDAILVLKTCQKLDPFNGQISDAINQLEQSKKGTGVAQALAQVQQNLSSGQTNAAEQILEQILNFPGADPESLKAVANDYLALRNFAKSEKAIQRVTDLLPDRSDSWYNLATIQAFRGEVSQCLVSLKKSLDINSNEIVKEPKVTNMRQYLFQDKNFAPLRQTPEFQAAFGTKP